MERPPPTISARVLPPPLPPQTGGPAPATPRNRWRRRTAERRPLTGLYLLVCAFIQAAYLLRFPPEGISLGVVMLVTVLPFAVAGLARLTGDSRLLWLLFGLLFTGIGIFLLAEYSLPNAYKVQQTLAWPQAPCTILFSAVTNESPEVRYEYVVDDKVWHSDTIDFLIAPGSLGGQPEDIVARYPSNSRGVCFYNPANPAEASLRRGWRSEHIAALFPLIFLAFGAALLLSTIPRCFSAKPRRPAG